MVCEKFDSHRLHGLDRHGRIAVVRDENRYKSIGDTIV
jgi:hypothetical protein